MLTEQQVSDFQTFGFLILRQVLSPDELKTINTEFELRLASTKRYTSPDDRPAYMSWPNLGPETPFFARLPEDSRICGVAEQLYGEDAIGLSCNAGSYVNETRWHPDASDPHIHGLKFVCYLQPLGANNGALRVIPGSHQRPFHDEVHRNLSRSGHGIGDVPAYICQTAPGDVVAFDFHLWHASWGGSTDRRMVSIIFDKNPHTPEQEKATRKAAFENVRLRARLAHDTFDSPGPEYHPHWLANPDRNSKRQHWIDRMRELGYLGSSPGSETR
ncbi:MAG: phytanoyl-CoA dioxygenase family protein [Candidatus Poribacteria bacterium]|nr:phytanoyl-CoA dioxygenase family protein [Candidatus Poribacteria bacterium]